MWERTMVDVVRTIDEGDYAIVFTLILMCLLPLFVNLPRWKKTVVDVVRSIADLDYAIVFVLVLNMCLHYLFNRSRWSEAECHQLLLTAVYMRLVAVSIDLHRQREKARPEESDK